MLLFIAWWVMCGLYIFFTVITSSKNILQDNDIALPRVVKVSTLLCVYLMFGPIILIVRLYRTLLNR